MKLIEIFIILLFLVIIVTGEQFPILSTVDFPLRNPSLGSENLTTILIYVVGSDLESGNQTLDDHAASDDLFEMVKGYGTGTQGLSVYIAYGGAQKEGWDGITYATLEQVGEDLQSDGVIGNNNINLYHNAMENMADPATLTSFINYVSLLHPEGRKIIFFWDHGSAWDGFGYDSNFNDDRLTLEELNTSLSKANQFFEIIGFDACLMANLEVAKAVSIHGSYLIASEDLEPGFGWDWEAIFSNFISQPTTDPVSISKYIVDSYLDNPRHKAEGKTMSVLNLQKTDEIATLFNQLSSSMSKELKNEDILKKISLAVIKTSPFGKMPTKSGDTIETSVDLLDFVTQISAQTTEFQDQAEGFNQSLRGFIVYSRQDGTRPMANGVSVYSPYNAILAAEKKAKMPPHYLDEFLAFLSQYVGYLEKLNLTNIIIEDRNGYTVPEGEPVDVRLKFIQKDKDELVILGEEPAYPDKPGHYPFPAWGGWGLQWKDKKSGENLTVPVYFEGYTNKGRERYLAYGNIDKNNEEINVMFDLYYHPVTGEISYYIVPYEYDTDGNFIIGKKSMSLETGDILTMKAYTMKSGSMGKYLKEYGSIRWSDSINLTYDMLPCGYMYQMLFTVSDVAKKIVYQDDRDVTIEC